MTGESNLWHRVATANTARDDAESKIARTAWTYWPFRVNVQIVASMPCLSARIGPSRVYAADAPARGCQDLATKALWSPGNMDAARASCAHSRSAAAGVHP